MDGQPAIVDELLDGPYPCALTSLDRDGSPYSVVVWCQRAGDRIAVNAADGLWLRNLRRDPRVSLVVVDTNILRHVNVRAAWWPSRRTAVRANRRALADHEGRPYAYSTPERSPVRVEIEPGASDPGPHAAKRTMDSGCYWHVWPRWGREASA
jgi:hypothetical protein